MWSNLLRASIATAIIFAVSEMSQRHPRVGAVILALPLLSVMAIIGSWLRFHDLSSASELARSTIVFVLLGLPFFLPLAFAERLGLGFWTAILAGIALACLTIGAWFRFHAA